MQKQKKKVIWEILVSHVYVEILEALQSNSTQISFFAYLERWCFFNVL